MQRLLAIALLCVAGLATALPTSAGVAVDVFQIAYGDVVSDGVPGPGAGNIEVGGAQDEYTFQGQAGDDAILDVLAGGAGDFRWALEAPDGTAVFDGLYVDRQVALAQTGTYTLTVRGPDATATGTYSFRLLLAPDPEEFAIAFGDTVSDGVPAAGAGNLEVPGAADVYSFDALAGQGAILDVLSGNNVLIRWRLEAPDGSVLFDTPLGDRQVSLAQTGTYLLTVDGNGIDDVGTYSFSVLEVPAAQSFTIAFGDTVFDGVPEPGAGNLEAPGAVDHYTFDAMAGQEAIFDALAGATGDFRWVLQAPDGTVLFDVFYVDQQLTLPQTGTYTLSLSGLQPTRFGTYSFQLLDVPPAAQAFSIAFGDTVSDGVPEPGAGNLEVPGAVDVYTFDAVGGQEAILDVLSGSTNDFRWALEGPDGTVLFDVFYVDQQVTLPQTGTYTLTVSGLQVTSFGTYSFSLLEAPQNASPVAVDDAATTSEDTAVTVDVLGNDTDADGGTLTVDAATQPANGTVVNNGTDVSYTPSADFNGTDSFTYTVSDGNGGTATATVTVTVEPVNDSPVASDDTATTDEDEPVTIDVLANDTDVDGDTLAVESVTQPGNGAVVSNGTDVTYTPAAGFDGTDAFTYTVSDGNGGAATATVTVTVEPAANGAPTVTAPAEQTNAEGEAVALPVTASDPDGDQLTFSATGLPDGLSIDPGTGVIAGTIAAGAAAASPYDVVVGVSDPGGLTASAAFGWTVQPAGALLVEIDIKPGSRRNCVRNDGHGVIPVVIFGSAAVDAGEIDPATVQLEGMGVERLWRWFLTFRLDVDHDGRLDLLVLIDDQAGAIPPGTTTATLTGRLHDGTAITGSDSICLLP